MTIILELCALRAFRHGDQADMVRHANNPKVALHLRDRFPSPYTRADAERWIAFTSQQSPVLDFAITIEDQPIGSIGLLPGSDVHRVSAEVGYWIGEEYWGRGIATCALRGLVRHAFTSFEFVNRVFAYVGVDHAASAHVLQKAGFRCEGQLIGAAIKQGKIFDQNVYAVTREEAR